MNQALQKNHINKATTAVSNISNLSMSGDYTLTFIQGEEGERGGGWARATFKDTALPPSCIIPVIEILPLSLSFYSLLLSFELFSVPFLEFLSPSLLLFLPPLFSNDLLLLELNQLLLPVLQVQVLTLENKELYLILAWEPIVAQVNHSYYRRLPALGRFYRKPTFLLMSIHST